VELLGLLSLIGQRMPDAMAELLAELRSQTKVAADYYNQVDMRLATLPMEIAAGVDPVAVATSMSEVFRQQLAATCLEDTAALLRVSTTTIKALSGELTATLKPVADEFRCLTSALAKDTADLVAAALRVEGTTSG
jgi:hypothetical protein